MSVAVTAATPSSLRARRVAAGGSGPWGRGLRGCGAQRGSAGRGAGRGGRCCAPTALRSSPRGRAAKLATLAARAALGQSPRVRSTKRAARADPEAALLGAADSAAPGSLPRCAPQPRSPRPHGPLSPAARATSAVFGSKAATAPVAGARPGAGAAATMPGCRPARAARVVLLTRRDCPRAARRSAGAGRARRHRGGRCCAPTALALLASGRAAKLAARAAPAPLDNRRESRPTRAARADPETALLGAADIAPPSQRLPLGQRQRCSERKPGRRPLPGLCQEPAWLQRSGCRRRTPQRCLQGCGPPAAGAPVRSREAQPCRPARAARFVLLTRRDCPSAARAASVASFAARPARRASQGTPAQRGPAPARPRRAARTLARTDRGTHRPKQAPARRQRAVRALACANAPDVGRHSSRNPRWSD